MGFTNFPNGITSFGMPIMGNIPATFGDVYFVDYRNGSDTNAGTSPDSPLKTLTGAHTKVTSNNNDIILIDGDSEIVETAMITWSKNRTHVIGLNGPMPFAGYGNGARITQGTTGVDTDTATLRVTGVRNTFSGIKFSNSSATATCLHCVEDGGEYTRWFNCEFYKSGLLTTDATGELLCNADSSQYFGCTFGDMVNSRGASGVERPNVKCDRLTLTDKHLRDVHFESCTFLHHAAHGDACHVHGSNQADVQRRLSFKDCQFWNNINAAAEMTECVAFDAAQIDGEVLLMNCAGMNTAALSATTGVYVQGAVPTAGTTGIAVQAT